MASLGPGMLALYNDLTTRLGDRLGNIHSSVRLFSHSCVDRLHRLQGRASSSPIINNDVETGPSSTSQSNNTQTGVNAAATTCTTTSECAENLSAAPRHSSRRSNRRERSRNSYRHSYPHGLISIRTLEKDRNVLAAILSIVVIAILATALAQFKWFSIYGDMCDSYFYNKADSIDKDASTNYGSYQIREFHPDYPGEIRLYVQPYLSSYSTESPVGTDYGLVSGLKFGCATPQILTLKRTIIGVCFLAIMCSLIQFFMDIMGTKRKWANYMRAHAVGNILTVLLCVLIIGLCYFVSILYERAQLYQLFRKWRSTPNGLLIKHFNGKPYQVEKRHLDILNVREVKFELSYYLVTLAGFLSILAAAVNLFRKPRQIFIERIGHNRHRNRPGGDESSLLNSDMLGNETSSYFPFYHPNSWIFNPNWNSFYNLDSNNSGSADRQMNVAFASPPPSVANCPPPPPYSP